MLTHIWVRARINSRKQPIFVTTAYTTWLLMQGFFTVTVAGFHKSHKPPDLPTGSTWADSTRPNWQKNVPILLRGTLVSIRMTISCLCSSYKSRIEFLKASLPAPRQFQTIIFMEKHTEEIGNLESTGQVDHLSLSVASNCPLITQSTRKHQTFSITWNQEKPYFLSRQSKPNTF